MEVELIEVEDDGSVKRTSRIAKSAVFFLLQSVQQGLLVGFHQAHAGIHLGIVVGVGQHFRQGDLHDRIRHQNHVEDSFQQRAIELAIRL